MRNRYPSGCTTWYMVQMGETMPSAPSPSHHFLIGGITHYQMGGLRHCFTHRVVIPESPRGVVIESEEFTEQNNERNNHCWLVGQGHPSEKYESIGMIIATQYFWENNPDGNQTTNQTGLVQGNVDSKPQSQKVHPKNWAKSLAIFAPGLEISTNRHGFRMLRVFKESQNSPPRSP